MKKVSIFFSLLPLLLLSLQFSEDPSTAALQQVKNSFHQDLENFSQAIDLYQQSVISFQQNEGSRHALQDAHLQARLSFKKIEYLLEYFDHEGTKRLLNGPPLPTVEPNVPEIRVLEPVGLQVLDELVFGDSPEAAMSEIIDLIDQLSAACMQVENYQLRIKMDHRHVFEAVRQELVRVFTLGVTGFDTPGSAHAIPEAQVALSSMANAIRHYLPLIEEKDQQLAQHIDRAFTEAVNYLKTNTDFEQFNRLEFLKTHINPLYKLSLDAHLTLGIETIGEVNPLPVALNYHSENLFAEDFLNPGAYANTDLSRSIIKKRVALGKMLFHDPILSGNNQRACVSCHQPERAFTDGLPKSLAINGEGHIGRNAPTLINSLYAERYFYDLREPNLERQINHVVLDKLEFNTDFFAVIDKLKLSSAYEALFKEAYADQPDYYLSKWSVSDALANYVISLRSFNSPFDQYVRGELDQIDPAIERGFNLFMGKAACGTCHFAPTFNGTVPPLYEESESEVLGVPATPDTLQAELDTDPGRIASGRPQDEAPFYRHSFKTTTIRNIAHTAPYMHNGVYRTLEEVVDFYNRGGGIGLGMVVPYQTLPDTPLELTEGEKQDLIAFMRSLSDLIDTLPPDLPKFDGRPEWDGRKVVY
jgi:cytochrome c peroxidase